MKIKAKYTKDDEYKDVELIIVSFVQLGSTLMAICITKEGEIVATEPVNLRVL